MHFSLLEGECRFLSGRFLFIYVIILSTCKYLRFLFIYFSVCQIFKHIFLSFTVCNQYLSLKNSLHSLGRGGVPFYLCLNSEHALAGRDVGYPEKSMIEGKG